MKNIIGKSWRDSASLIVLTKRNRELLSRVEDRGGVNYDILLQTRTRSASFANSVVFPGGVSDPVDGSPRWLELLSSFGYSKQDFEALHHPSSVVTPIFQSNPIQRHIELRITAIRETFEELGLLICSRKKKNERSGPWASVIEDIDVKYWQDRLTKNPGNWLNLCEELQCYPDIWSLNYWSNWLTPTKFTNRFDTAFFITALKDKPQVTSNSEVVKVEWSSPLEVLESNSQLQPPQVYELNRLSHVKDIEELIQFAKERSKYVMPVLFPVYVKLKDGNVVLLPGDDLYPESVDYIDNTIKYLDKTILELREGCKTLHRFEFTENTNSKNFVIHNYKPQHHISMEDKVYQGFSVN